MQKARQSHEISICGDSKESLRKDRHNVLHERFSIFQSITTSGRLVAFLISLFLIVVGSKESHTNETRMCLSAPSHENPCDRRGKHTRTKGKFRCKEEARKSNQQGLERDQGVSFNKDCHRQQNHTVHPQRMFGQHSEMPVCS